MNRKTLLIQFAKWPEPGRVKTRLAAGLGHDAALEAHIRLTKAVMRHLAATNHDVAFWWDQSQPPPGAVSASIEAALADPRFMIGHQAEGDLGARMHSGLAEGLRDYENTLIIGSDCPSVDPAYIEQAVAALSDADIVLGPSEDGGFVLIGARRIAEDMLTNVNWGTSSALAQTQERLAAAGLQVQLLEPRWDVDEPEDWERFLTLYSDE